MRDQETVGIVSRPTGMAAGASLSRRAFMARAGALGISTSALVALIACGGSSKAAQQPTAMPTMIMPTTTGAATTRTAASAVAVDPNSPQVGIDNFNFSPKSLVVPVGTTVTWTNRDDVPHTVTSRDKKFSSQALDTDERFTFTFTEPGTYAYFCSIHTIMTAEIVVK
jgi:plastocyanin